MNYYNNQTLSSMILSNLEYFYLIRFAVLVTRPVLIHGWTSPSCSDVVCIGLLERTMIPLGEGEEGRKMEEEEGRRGGTRMKLNKEREEGEEAY